MIGFERTLHTDGTGYWSDVIAPVSTTKIAVAYVSDDGDFGELRVYFDNTWVTQTDGLIYTDPLFMQELRSELKAAGLSAGASKELDYSEQGMQGDNYVSFDIGKKFITSWNKKIARFAI